MQYLCSIYVGKQLFLSSELILRSPTTHLAPNFFHLFSKLIISMSSTTWPTMCHLICILEHLTFCAEQTRNAALIYSHCRVFFSLLFSTTTVEWGYSATVNFWLLLAYCVILLVYPDSFFFSSEVTGGKIFSPIIIAHGFVCLLVCFLLLSNIACLIKFNLVGYKWILKQDSTLVCRIRRGSIVP